MKSNFEDNIIIYITEAILTEYHSELHIQNDKLTSTNEYHSELLNFCEDGPLMMYKNI